jgi:hypothetical protein
VLVDEFEDLGALVQPPEHRTVGGDETDGGDETGGAGGDEAEDALAAAFMATAQQV